jgi:arylsulfatase A-like enzyme
VVDRLIPVYRLRLVVDNVAQTGRYGRRTGVTAHFGPGSTNGLPASEVSIAKLLQSSGYRTAMIGKWSGSTNTKLEVLLHVFFVKGQKQELHAPHRLILSH